MKNRKKLPVWLLIIFDILIIAAYTGGFYGLYYLKPRQLTSSGIKTVQIDTSATAQASKIDTSSDTSNSTNTSSKTTTTSTTKKANTAKSTTAKSTTKTTSWAKKYADKFTNKIVSTDSSYSSSDISIIVSKKTEGSGSDTVTYYVADIYVANIKCLQSGFADNTYGVGYTENVLSMDKTLNAILAINGDYYGNGGNGVVIRNGEAYRTTTSNSDVCVLYYNGTMKTFSAEEFDVQQAIADGAYQAWCFGPELLDASGSSMTSFTADGHVMDINPRSAIGYYEPGHYCLVLVDGRQNGYSKGMTLTQLSSVFEKLGCKQAYNLDGGKSSEMTFNNALVNNPCDGGREVSDCILIKEVASK